MTNRTKDVDRCRRGCYARPCVGGLCRACWSFSTRTRYWRTLIVGMNPADEKPHDGPAFVGSKSGRYLARLCGDADLDLTERFTLVNLFPSVWRSAGEAQERAIEMHERIIHQQFRRVILCGRGVGGAFHVDTKWFTTSLRRGYVAGQPWTWEAIVIPHPSGLNREWNDRQTKELGIELMTRVWEQAT